MHQAAVAVVVPDQTASRIFHQGIHVVRVFICPANGNQYLRLTLNITGFLRRADQHERDGEHKGKTEQVLNRRSVKTSCSLFC